MSCRSRRVPPLVSLVLVLGAVGPAAGVAQTLRLTAGGYSTSAISGDGRFVVYPVFGQGISLRDRFTGIIERIDISTGGVAADLPSLCPSVSDDGRFVAFVSADGSLVAGDTNGQMDVFVRDRVAQETTRVSLSTSGVEGAGPSACPVQVDGSGRYVVFANASPLVTGDTNNSWDIFVRDRTSGTTTLASVASDGTMVTSTDGGTYPTISRDGRVVAFMSTAADVLVGGANDGSFQVIVRDLQASVTSLASRSTGGAQGNNLSWFPGISGDGRVVAFYSRASNLVANDLGNLEDAFVHDRQTGETTRVSVSSTGEAGNGVSGAGPGHDTSVSLSSDGRYVAFTSYASNLVPADTNNAPDIFVRDRLTSTTRRVTVNGHDSQVAACPPPSTPNAVYPTLTGSGGEVLFDSTLNFGGSCPATGIYLRRIWPATPGDATPDRKADLTVFRPSNATWYTFSPATSSATSMTWGLSTDVPVGGDFDGDMRADAAVFRSGTWWVRDSWTGFATQRGRSWGTSSDVPVPADYDGDLQADYAVFRPSAGNWYLLLSGSGFTASVARHFGLSTDVPAPADFDGDRKADIAVYRPSTGGWYVLYSSSNFTTGASYQFGTTGDRPAPADYDGDGRADLAVYRPSTGVWYRRFSATNFTTSAATAWGSSTDVPVPSDFNGDGKTDLAVFRPSNGAWYVYGQFTAAWGRSGDVPILRR